MMMVIGTTLLYVTTLLLSAAAGVYSAEHYPVELGAKYIHDVAVSTREMSAFAPTLFAEVCADEGAGNVLLSPLSMYQLLALLDLGTTPDSDTYSELGELLGSEEDRANVNSLRNVTAEGIEFDLATSVWADELKRSFIRKARKKQGAESFPLPSTYGPINEWVSDQTNGLVPELFGDEEMESSTEALLIQTVYFKGIWTKQFNPELTRMGETFTKSDGTETSANLMYAKQEMNIILNSDALGGASAVILDYGTSGSAGEFAGIFILPGGHDTWEEYGSADMESLLSGLATHPLTDLLDESVTTTARVSLPRFKLEFGLNEPYSMKQVLKRMGMTSAFDEAKSWQFEKMSNQDLYVDDIVHGAAMVVNEQGSEAAAASGARMRGRSADRSPYLIFDRPFVVIIMHRPTGTPLFMGKLEDPEFI